MTETAIAIGIDIGASGVRAVAIDAALATCGQGEAKIAAERRRDPGAIWHCVEAALTALGNACDLSAVRALSVDGTSGTLIPCDSAGAPVADASLYNDRAEAGDVARIAEAAPPDSPARGTTSPLARMLGLKDREGIALFLHEADWALHRLGAPAGVSDANNALKSGYDPRTNDWPGWIAGLGLDRARLPRVVEPGTRIGEIDSSLARRFGIRAGAALVAGTTDGCASFLATGADRPGDGVTALGSTLTLKLLSDAPVFAPQYGIYSHHLLGLWLPGGAANAGAAVIGTFFSAERIAELSKKIDPERDSGLDYYPLPSPGERFPISDPSMAPRLEPRPADDALFLHGLFEGLARIEALAYQRLAELGAPRVRRVLSVGGGSVNPVWTRLRARILDVPVERAAATEAAYGTARLALGALS